MNASKKVWRIYHRLERAERLGTGVRLSADDVATLYDQDSAIMTVIENIRFAQEGWGDGEEEDS